MKTVLTILAIVGLTAIVVILVLAVKFGIKDLKKQKNPEHETRHIDPTELDPQYTDGTIGEVLVLLEDMEHASACETCLDLIPRIDERIKSALTKLGYDSLEAFLADHSARRAS